MTTPVAQLALHDKTDIISTPSERKSALLLQGVLLAPLVGELFTRHVDFSSYPWWMRFFVRLYWRYRMQKNPLLWLQGKAKERIYIDGDFPQLDHQLRQFMNEFPDVLIRAVLPLQIVWAWVLARRYKLQDQEEWVLIYLLQGCKRTLRGRGSKIIADEYYATSAEHVLMKRGVRVFVEAQSLSPIASEKSEEFCCSLSDADLMIVRRYIRDVQLCLGYIPEKLCNVIAPMVRVNKVCAGMRVAAIVSTLLVGLVWIKDFKSHSHQSIQASGAVRSLRYHPPGKVFRKRLKKFANTPTQRSFSYRCFR